MNTVISGIGLVVVGLIWNAIHPLGYAELMALLAWWFIYIVAQQVGQLQDEIGHLKETMEDLDITEE